MWCTTCLHTPAEMRSGISQVAQAHHSTVSPEMSPAVASTIGADVISTILAPATPVIAAAPIATQYGGSRSRGRSG